MAEVGGGQDQPALSWAYSGGLFRSERCNHWRAARRQEPTGWSGSRRARRGLRFRGISAVHLASATQRDDLYQSCPEAGGRAVPAAPAIVVKWTAWRIWGVAGISTGRSPRASSPAWSQQGDVLGSAGEAVSICACWPLGVRSWLETPCQRCGQASHIVELHMDPHAQLREC